MTTPSKLEVVYVAPPSALSTMEHLRTHLAWWRRNFYDAWLGCQLINNGAKYSIERMLALEEYTRNTSLARVLTVTISLPLLIVALVLCQESIPLQDPASGWENNSGFWIRVGLIGFAIAQAVSNKLEPWLQIPPLSTKQTLTFCILVGAGHVAAGMIVAEIWVFPIPFFMLVLSSVSAILIIGGLRAIVGARGFRLITSQSKLRRRMNFVSGLQALMGSAYPAYQVLFNKATHTKYELPVLMLLPLFKLVMKAIFASVASHKEDMIPEQVVFTVDFFDAFYLATFMQSLSFTNIALVLAVDLLQTAIDLYELNQRTQSILAQLRMAAGITATNYDGNLLTTIRLLCSKPDVLHKQMRPKIQARSCIYHRLSDEGRTLLEKINSSVRSYSTITPHNSAWVESRTPSLATASRLSKKWLRHGYRNFISVQPIAMMPEQLKATQPPGDLGLEQLRQSLAENNGVLQEALEILFASECIVLTEYLEIFVPIIYGTFLLVMTHLPSRQYHTEMEGITQDNVSAVVSRMFTYALLEFLSFVVLAVIAKRNCGIHVLYQVAFVLETQLSSVLTKTVLWLLVTLTYRVTHFGVDFSFRFEWLRSQNE